MDNGAALVTALATAFGAGGIGILVATGGSPRRLRRSVLSRRYLTWLALAVVYWLAVSLGVAGATALAVAVAAQSARECARLLRLGGVYAHALLLLCVLAPLLFLAGAGEWFPALVLLGALTLPLARGRAAELDVSARLALGAVLLGWPLAHFVVLAGEGEEWLVLALFGTAVSDVCAFAAGTLLRGPKLLPRVSPGKTWAGLGGNLLGAALALLLISPLLPALAAGDVLMLAGIIGIGGCAGDLSESLLKRWAGVKDSGGWLPGFGGLLDRIDSLLVVAPALAAYLAFTGLGG